MAPPKKIKKAAAPVPEESLGEMKKGWPKSHRPRTSPGRKLNKRAKRS